jgi:hypothetical protein
MAGTEHPITLHMDTKTVTALADSGSALYGFVAVRASDAAARPLVWLRSQAYSAITRVTWSPGWQAYTSTGAAAAGQPVRPGFSAPIAPGQVLRVSGAGGTGAVLPSPFASETAVLNERAQPYLCGLSQRAGDGDDAFAPVCMLPLYGGGLQIIVPLPTVLLMFSTVAAEPGTVAEVATGPGVLLELEGAPGRAVRFDVDAGWAWSGGTWARAVPAAADLVALLVQPPANPGAWFASAATREGGTAEWAAAPPPPAFPPGTE